MKKNTNRRNEAPTEGMKQNSNKSALFGPDLLVNFSASLRTKSEKKGREVKRKAGERREVFLKGIQPGSAECIFCFEQVVPIHF